MPAESEKQRKFMALVNAFQRGKVNSTKVGSKVKKAAKSMTKKQSRDFMQKKAEFSDLGGRRPVDPSRYNAVKMRRTPTPADLALIEEESSKMFPDIIREAGEPIAADMASPSKGALLYGLLGGLAGGMAGKGIGDLAKKAKPELNINSEQLALYGGATTAALAAMLAFYKRHVKNKELEDQMLRLPPGATRRDRDWNPALALDYDPDYISRVAQLNAALMGRLSPKELKGFQEA